MASTHSNPFVQGGWETSTFRPDADQVANPPSIYGALPMNTGAPNQSGTRMQGATLFQFINPNPTILNSVVVSTHRDGAVHQLVCISTDTRYTLFKDTEQKIFAHINWYESPTVEFLGGAPKCEVESWLKIVNNRNRNYGGDFCFMDVKGTKYYWCLSDNAIMLHLTPSSSASPLAIVTNNGSAINLEMSNVALTVDLFQSCIVAITLFSGKKIVE